MKENITLFKIEESISNRINLVSETFSSETEAQMFAEKMRSDYMSEARVTSSANGYIVFCCNVPAQLISSLYNKDLNGYSIAMNQSAPKVRQPLDDYTNDTVEYGNSADLIRCPVCGKEISYKAASCPHCGNPNYAKKDSVSAGKIIAIVLGVILMIIGFAILYFGAYNMGRNGL